MIIKNPEYTIAVYEDQIIIRGKLTAETLMALNQLGKAEGFTHLAPNQDGKGFRLIKAPQ